MEKRTNLRVKKWPTMVFIKVIEDFIKENPHDEEIIIAWDEIKKIVYRKIKDNEMAMLRKRRRDELLKWTLSVY